MERFGTYAHRYLFVALVCATLIVFVVSVSVRNSGKLSVYFLDIGQGDAVYVRTPSGRDMLVDGGPSSVVLRRLSEVMPWYDRSIDIVLETHPDADHIGGLPEVIERYRIGAFMEPGVESLNEIDDEIEKRRREKGIDSILAREGMRINFGDGAYFDVFFPDVDVSRYETNTASVVGRLGYGSTSVMLTGDSPRSIENYLVSRFGAFLASDILKAGHHGSDTSSGEVFVRTVAPLFAVVSSGRDNRYGHPHRRVTDLFESLNIGILRTDQGRDDISRFGR